jgi:hypothetical protein
MEDLDVDLYTGLSGLEIFGTLGTIIFMIFLVCLFR